MKSSRVAAVFLFVLVLAQGMVGWGAGIQPAQSAQERGVAPNFRLTDLSGRPLELSSFKGKVVLIDFWATWCPPCRKMIPHLKELRSAYQGRGFEVIGISVGEDAGTVKSFAKSNGMSYPIAVSSDGQTEQAYGGIRGIPTTFLIDKQGRIAQKYVGYHDKASLETEIKKLLAE